MSDPEGHLVTGVNGKLLPGLCRCSRNEAHRSWETAPAAGNGTEPPYTEHIFAGQRQDMTQALADGALIVSHGAGGSGARVTSAESLGSEIRYLDEQLAQAYRVVWILARRAGGFLTITDEEMTSVPQAPLLTSMHAGDALMVHARGPEDE